MVITYKCPGCGAAMEYDAATGKLVCAHCGTQMTVEEHERWEKQTGTTQGTSAGTDEDEGEFDEAPLGDDTYTRAEHTADDDRTIHMRVYHCPSCGAELMTDENTAATICSFCGNPGLIADRMSGVRQPKSLIPFTLTKDEAKERLRSWAGKNRLAPRDFSHESTLEKVTGIYVPYWLYDYHVNVSLWARATRTRMMRRGDIEYVYTDHFHVYRSMDIDFDRVPADASYRMDDDVMESLEPYDYEGLKEFDMAYLAGYQAEKFNADSTAFQDRAKERVREAAVGVTRSSIEGYATVNVVDEQVDFSEREVDYVMLPVWVLNYRYRGQNYIYTLNGQTGKMNGRLPVSTGRVAAHLAVFTAAAFVILSLLSIVGVFG